MDDERLSIDIAKRERPRASIARVRLSRGPPGDEGVDIFTIVAAAGAARHDDSREDVDVRFRAPRTARADQRARYTTVHICRRDESASSRARANRPMSARGDAGRVRILARLAVFAALLITSASSGEADADAHLAGARVSGSAGEAFGGSGRALRAALDDREVDDYHYIFSTDCKPYMDWQSVALYHSWIRAGSPGRFTRILSCAKDDYLYRDIMPTHLTPTYDAIDPSDNYAAYNLPGGILHWTQHNTTDRKWIVKLDADMIIRKPLSVREGLRADPGLVAAGYYGYLEGVDNEMAGMFVDEDARSRLAKVGGWEIFWAEDLRKAAPLWFEYTKRVRQDARVHWPFRGTGDVFITKENPRPWISEMYGYVFGTAVAGLRHNVQHSTQLYAGMAPWDEASYDPFLIHYGILIEIDDWKWDKHDELNGRGGGAHDKLRCDLPFTPFPEVPERLLAKRASAANRPRDPERRRAEISAELMRALNRAIRAYRNEHCGEPLPEETSPEETPEGNDARTERTRDVPKLAFLRGEPAPVAAKTTTSSSSSTKTKKTTTTTIGSGSDSNSGPGTETKARTVKPATEERARQAVQTTPDETSRVMPSPPPSSSSSSSSFASDSLGSLETAANLREEGGDGARPAEDTLSSEDLMMYRVWVSFSFIWGCVLTFVCWHLSAGCRRRGRGASVVRRRLGARP